eukprot:2569713-Amphidinium_carterae.1
MVAPSRNTKLASWMCTWKQRNMFEFNAVDVACHAGDLNNFCNGCNAVECCSPYFVRLLLSCKCPGDWKMERIPAMALAVPALPSSDRPWRYGVKVRGLHLATMWIAKLSKKDLCEE